MALECAGPPTHTKPREFAEEMSANEAIALFCFTNKWQRLEEAKQLERHADVLYNILVAGGADPVKTQHKLSRYRYRVEDLRKPFDEPEVELTDPFLMHGLKDEDDE